MPEIPARELRRLESLSERIVRVEDRSKLTRTQRDEAREEVKQLKAKVRELEKTIRDLTAAAESSAAGSSEQIDELLSENQRLADDVATAVRTADKVTAQSAKLADTRDSLKTQVQILTAEGKKLNKDLAAASKANTTLTSQLTTATAQLQADGVSVLIPPDKVGGLLDDFVSKIDIGGLEIQEGDIRLSVAFGTAGESAGFLIPSIAADDDLPLHTINLSLVKKAPTLSD